MFELIIGQTFRGRPKATASEQRKAIRRKEGNKKWSNETKSGRKEAKKGKTRANRKEERLTVVTTLTHTFIQNSD